MLSELRPFQSTFPHGERRRSLIMSVRFRQFQSTFPHGERQHLMLLLPALSRFQSTFPHGERQPVLFLCAYINNRFQSTFPHGERQRRYSTRRKLCCFNPRSRTGNDGIISGLLSRRCGSFNPRSRTGNDFASSDYTAYATVSIHVPARGTTSTEYASSANTTVSIHVPARGTTYVGENVARRY